MSTRLLVWVGELSYSLYLWHWPILVLGNYYKAGELTLENRLLCVALTFVIASASAHEIEKPLRDSKKVRSYAIWTGFVVLWVCFICVLFYSWTVITPG